MRLGLLGLGRIGAFHAEACTLSLREHRPVQIEEVRVPSPSRVERSAP